MQTDPLCLFCFRSCLRGGSNKEYYEVLGVDRRANVDAIKKAYKKASLSLHPDKIAQRGRAVTDEDKAQLLRVKEAYNVLVDPKKRRLYDQLGEQGLKMIEDPSRLMSQEGSMQLIKNFQSNRGDRIVMSLLVIFIFSAILLEPILFSLKCDDLLPQVPWTALWTPMWIFDLFLLASGVSSLCMKDSHEDDEDEAHPHHVTTTAEMLSKALDLVFTCLFIWFQIFLMMKMDKSVSFGWFATFAPWFLFDGLKFFTLGFTGCCVTLPPPDHASVSINLEEGETEEHVHHEKVQAEMDYWMGILKQQAERHSAYKSAMRVWLAVFIALKLDGAVSWNWGLVLLPIWIYLYLENCFACASKLRASFATANIDPALIEQGLDTDPEHIAKMQYATMLDGQCVTVCLCQGFPILMAILLVCNLEVTRITTFVIILPVFIFVMACGSCFCLLFLCLTCFDTSAIPSETDDREGGNGRYSPPDAARPFAEAAAESKANRTQEQQTTATAAPAESSTPIVIVAPPSELSPPPPPPPSASNLSAALPPPAIQQQQAALQAPTSINADID